MKIGIVKNILATSSIAFLALSHAQSPGSSASPQTAAESPDAEFVQQASRGSLAEVELSKLAVNSASSPAVRRFAQKMVHDHTQNNKELAVIAAHENIAVPTTLDTEHRQLLENLRTEHGNEFDRTYVQAMQLDHQKMVELLKSAEATVSTEELRTFTKKTLPVVQAHLQMAQALPAN